MNRPHYLYFLRWNEPMLHTKSALPHFGMISCTTVVTTNAWMLPWPKSLPTDWTLYVSQYCPWQNTLIVEDMPAVPKSRPRHLFSDTKGLNAYWAKHFSIINVRPFLSKHKLVIAVSSRLFLLGFIFCSVCSHGVAMYNTHLMTVWFQDFFRGFWSRIDCLFLSSFATASRGKTRSRAARIFWHLFIVCVFSVLAAKKLRFAMR